MSRPGRLNIPRKTVYRLSVYLRCLSRLRENGIETVSSEALAKVAGVKPTPLRTHRIRMAILAVPTEAAQEVTNTLVEAGAAGILNFSPNVLSVPEEVMVNNVNLAIELENLSYFIQG
ncbi:MAG: hypothetical protein MUE94_05690 [Verrucomicrobia bacterium]|nr:hypothetical protein [Verrucomicrobiota bacterium]